MSDTEHGQRLTDDEYDRMIVELHTKSNSGLTNKEISRKEFDLIIDYRLGKDFPSHRREQLWKAQKRISKKRGRLIVKYLLRKLFKKGIRQDAQKLAGYLVEEYAKVLSESELEAFFGRNEVQSPILPINSDEL